MGAFITMNPGYAGRTELPENLKALFRGCAMVAPDFENIIEIELSAEGFLEAKTLAHKFISLFLLSKELLSKQAPHHDTIPIPISYPDADADPHLGLSRTLSL